MNGDTAGVMLTEAQSIMAAVTGLVIACTGLVSAIGAVLAARRAGAGVAQGRSNAARIAAVHGCVEAQAEELHGRLDGVEIALRNQSDVATTAKGRDAGNVPAPIEHPPQGLRPRDEHPL